MLSSHSAVRFDWDEDKKIVSIINTFLKKIDLGIDSFGIEKNKNTKDLKLPESMSELLREKLINEFSKKEYFYHSDDNGNLVRFEKDKESNGTSKLFELLPFFIQVLRDGLILFVDEIEGSFHPHIAELIIKIFNDPLLNRNNAQLIFTTHDLSLMESDVMRKDQIYLTEKDPANGTRLYCLESYEAGLKDNSPFSKWYNEGRLGAIPEIDYRNISDAIKGLF
ncbi:hypothetical protein MNBD_GAMMA11-1554 [hydrothermal vent metagenome]|uniref:ATPase AAA-type core domain-containing protein n=1 Tax=hydrothermal vent metagenome TaxID=652676 RepID=A0A3B0X4V1_9ZZZZ